MRLGAKGWVLVARTARGWGCRPVRLCHRGNSQEFRGDQRGKSAEAIAAFRRQQEQQWKHRNRTVLTYLAAGVVGMAGLSYAAVPLYRLYCQVRGGRGRGGGRRRRGWSPPAADDAFPSPRQPAPLGLMCLKGRGRGSFLWSVEYVIGE